ncbi:MAG: response regulator [Hyphomicrobiaceae bacterium]|nr:response regulator [Hyphomicrobiaceae bacterium]
MTTVTIIEDEKGTLTSLKMAFQAEGYHVDAFDDPLVALPKIICVPPRLLILNGRMPGMHGIDVFKTYRRYCKGPVIFLSASSDEIEEQLQADGCPANAYVAKPHSIRQLLHLAREFVRP